MLDEILERDLCTYSLSDNKFKEYLRGTNLSNDLSGLNRAMTIVTRGFIMERGGYEDEFKANMEFRKKIADDAKVYLKLWCGFFSKTDYEYLKNTYYKDNQKGIEEICGWFPRYLAALYQQSVDFLLGKVKESLDNQYDEIKQGIINQKSYLNGLFSKQNEFVLFSVEDCVPSAEKAEGTDIRQIIKALKIEDSAIYKAAGGVDRSMNRIIKLHNKKTQFPKSMFTEDLQDSSDNDNKKITYDSIIASAFAEGKLQRRILVAKEKIPKIIRGVTVQKEISDNEEKVILALTAHCLINAVEKSGSLGYCCFVKRDISNWIQLDKASFDDTKLLSYQFVEGTETTQIFILERDLLCGNTCKIKINDKWAKYYKILSFDDQEPDIEKGYCVAMRDSMADYETNHSEE